MHIALGTVLTLDIEKPVAGGRMLARHEGRVALVWAAVPGERVRARVDRVAKGVIYAETVEVLTPSQDRRPAADWRCGGTVYAHVDYQRQLRLKGEVVRDALARIGKVPLSAPPMVIGSPEEGYRMRARLHTRDGRIGFYREGSHELCGLAESIQLRADTVAWLERAASKLGIDGLRAVRSIEIAENIPATERVCHLELRGTVNVGAVAALSTEAELTGLTASRFVADAPQVGYQVERLAGTPTVTDVLHVSDDSPPRAVRLRRDVRAFFQGNRYLLEPFMRDVIRRIPWGPVVDLYAGVGLFGLAVAAAGGDAVVLVEGDPVSAADLQVNAEPFEPRVQVHRASVESYLRNAPRVPGATFILDPPRTGVSSDAVNGVISRRPSRVVYVACDPATLARDVRAFLNAGYELEDLTGFDLFPNTAHIETVVTLTASMDR